ncbi:MAG: glycosyltransferase [Saprospiraceae bacterium]
MLEQIILYVFLAATTVQLFFWLYFFARLAFYKNQKEGNGVEQNRAFYVTEEKQDLNPIADDFPPVSIIICAHNESQNLKTHLDRILNQTYRSYEVLVVSHNSSDESLNILSSLQHRFKHLRIVKCNDSKPGKKIALAKGIREAKHQVLLLTDADCVPASDEWLKKMVARMKGETQIVLGFAPYSEAPGFLNKFIRFEAIYTAMQYLSFALAGLPFMGVGRNMAYRKRLFQQAKGLEKHQHLASGDDDLFVNEVATKNNTAIQLDPGTFVFSKPKLTWKAYYRQKTRHLSTGKHYKLPHRILLFSLAMSHYLHYVLGAVIVILNFSIIFALLGYTVRMSVVMAFSSVILKRLQNEKLWLWVPALDAFLILYYVLFTPAILMNSNTQRWN